MTFSHLKVIKTKSMVDSKESAVLKSCQFPIIKHYHPYIPSYLWTLHTNLHILTLLHTHDDAYSTYAIIMEK